MRALLTEDDFLTGNPFEDEPFVGASEKSGETLAGWSWDGSESEQGHSVKGSLSRCLWTFGACSHVVAF